MDFSFEKDLVLENERAILSPLLLNDFDHLLPIATHDPSLLQYSPTPIHTSELLQAYIQTALKERRIKFRYAFSIFDKELGQYAGSTSFANVSNYDRRIEIGWTWVGRQFQQTGLNRKCKHLLLQYAFDDLNFERVEFRIDERNKASRNAVEKIGGKLDGILRSHMLMTDGFRRSTCYYSILRSEWPDIRKVL